MNDAALWQQLSDRGLVSGSAPAGTDHPWPIRIMVGAGAWTGSIFVLAFLGGLTFDLLDHSVTRLPIAIASLVGARFLARIPELITQQLGLIAAALAQTLMVWSAIDDLDGKLAISIGLIAAGVVSLWVPLTLFRVWSGALVLSALVAFLDAIGLPSPLALTCVLTAAAAAGWWLRPVLGRHHSLLHSLALACALFALGAAIILSRATVDLWLGPDSALAGGAIAAIALLLINLAVIVRLCRDHRVNPLAPALLVGLLLLATWTTPAVGAAMLLILLGFGRADRWLLALGLIGLPLALSAHYYMMQWSLNLKALALVASGILLLAARAWLRQPRPSGTAGNPEVAS